jgi:hypothetical protein
MRYAGEKVTSAGLGDSGESHISAPGTPLAYRILGVLAIVVGRLALQF